VNDHVIRVIIQGYNRLSGAFKEAADQAGPHLERINRKLRDQRNEARASGSAMDSLGNSFANNSEKIEKARVRMERITQSMERFRERAREAHKEGESVGQMWDRLNREGRAPNLGGGVGFLSKKEFIELESQRRRIEDTRGSVDKFADSLKRLREQSKTKVFILDDMYKGMRTGLTGQTGDPDWMKNEIDKRLGEAKDHMRRARQELRFQLEEELQKIGAEREREWNTQKIAREQQIAASRSRVEQIEAERKAKRAELEEERKAEKTREDRDLEDSKTKIRDKYKEEEAGLTSLTSKAEKRRQAERESAKKSLEVVEANRVAEIRAAEDASAKRLAALLKERAEKDINLKRDLEDDKRRIASKYAEREAALVSLTRGTAKDKEAQRAQARKDLEALRADKIAEIRAIEDIANTSQIKLRTQRTAEDKKRERELEDEKRRIKSRYDEEEAGLRAVARGRAKRSEEEQAALNKELEAIRNRRIAEIRAAEDAHARRMANLKKEREEEDKSREEYLNNRVAEENKLQSALASIRKSAFERETAERKRAVKVDFEERRQTLEVTGGLSRPDAIRQVNDELRETIRTGGLVEQTFARIGFELRNLQRGWDGGRRDLSDFRGEAGRAQFALARFGAEAGRAVKSIDNFVNIRMVWKVSIMQVFLSVILQLAAALAALVGSLVAAAGALAGALVAGALQAIPVVGLLAAAFNRLGAAMKVVQLREKEREGAEEAGRQRLRSIRAATDSLTDARYNLARAIERVGDAERGVRQAHERVADAIRNQRDAIAGLAEARRDAARRIVDAAMDERDAELSLREAELGVLDARRRLREESERQRRSAADIEQAQAEVREARARLELARQQGDQAEIVQAQHALAVAQQNVSRLQDQVASATQDEERLRLSVERADLTLDQARVRRQRAVEENRRRQRQGVEGSPEVDSAKEGIVDANRRHRDAVLGVEQAQRGLRDANHSVQQSNRAVLRSQQNLAEAMDKTTASSRNARREWDELTAAEKRLVLAVERLKTEFRKAASPITDIIVGAFTRGIDRAIVVIQDPRIQAAFKDLAEEIAEVIDRFTSWLASEEGRRELLFFIKEAKESLPIIADAAANFGQALLNIGRYASPVFTYILETLKGWGESLKNASGDAERTTGFFTRGQEHLAGWFEFFGAFGDFLLALTGAPADSGLGMLESMSASFRDWATWIRENPEKTLDFFNRMHESLRILLPMLGEFFGKMFEAFTSETFHEFTTWVIETLFPAMLDAIHVLGAFAKLINEASKVPILGDLVDFALRLGIIYLFLSRLFPLLKLTLGLFSIKRFFILGAIVLLVEHWGELEDALRRVKNWFDRLDGTMKGIIIGGFALVSAAILGVIGHSALFIVRFFGMRWILMALWGLMRAHPIGILLTAAFLLWQNWDKVAAVFRKVRDAVVDAWKWMDRSIQNFRTRAGEILRALPGQIYDWLVGGLKRLFRINSPSEVMRSIGRDILNGLLQPFNNLGKTFAGVWSKMKEGLSTVITEIKDKLSGIGDFFKDMWDKIPVPLKRLIGTATAPHRAAARGAQKVVERVGSWLGFAKGGEIPGGQEGEAVPIIAHVGEWVLNQRQQGKLASALKTTPQRVAGMLFGGKKDDKREFAEGGIVGGLLNINRSQLYRNARRAGADKILRAIGRGGDATERLVMELSGVNDVRRFRRDPQNWKNALFALFAALPFIPLTGAVRGTAVGVRRAADTRIADNIRKGIESHTQWGTISEGTKNLMRAANEYSRRAGRRLGDETGTIAPFVGRGVAEGGRLNVYQRGYRRLDQLLTNIGANRVGTTANLNVGGRVTIPVHEVGKPPRIKDVTKNRMRFNEDVPGSVRPPQHLFRSISEEEYRLARRRGYFQSDGRMNLVNTEGTVAAFSDPSFYLPGKLASSKPGVHRGRIIRIRYRDADGWIYDSDGYVKTNKRIPFEQIDAAPRVNTVRDTEGMVHYHVPRIPAPRFSAGGGVKGAKEGQAVPVIAHVGEWILNKAQQTKLAQRLRMPLQELKLWLFGSAGKPGSTPPGKAGTNQSGATARPFEGPGFKMRPHTDEHGVEIWFIEFANGTWGEVAGRHAKRIMDTKGAWMPEYVRRRGPLVGVSPATRSAIQRGGQYFQQFALGGEVSYSLPGTKSVPSMSNAMQPLTSPNAAGGGKIQQNFTINTATEKADIDYIMRVAQMHAEKSF
jgi:hypothetical protein